MDEWRDYFCVKDTPPERMGLLPGCVLLISDSNSYPPIRFISHNAT